MKLTNNLFKVELKKSKDAVTGKMGLSWLVHVMEDFGIKKMISEEYEKGSNREIEYFKKIMTAVMTRVAGGERVEDVENLRVDAGLLESLGWGEMMSADTYLNLIKDKRSNAKLRRIKKVLYGDVDDQLEVKDNALSIYQCVRKDSQVGAKILLQDH